MNSFLSVTIGACVFILLYSVMLIASPDNSIFNWVVSTICGSAIRIGLGINKKKQP